jgi:RNA polymerase sigma-70 factor (ECF subfamily)
MGYLRTARSVAPATADSSCIRAFDADLDYIFATLRRLGARPAELDDLTQEVFVVLHRNWDSIDTSSPLRPYLFGVAFRVLCAHRRRQKREVPHGVVEVEDVALDPETSLGRKESNRLLHDALESVPLRRRVVVVMHELDGIPAVEIARQLTISPFTVYARLRKAHKELRAALRRLTGENESKGKGKR